VFGIGCLCSCVSTPVREARAFTWLTNSSRFILLHPENIEKPLDGLQLVSVSFRGHEHQMITWVKADENEINMILLNEMGANMGELSFKDGVVSFSSAVFPGSLRPEYIVADFQLCFYNAAALAEALQRSGLSFEETENGRRILERNNVIIEIIRNQNHIKLTNHLRGYVYTLEGDF
jgi:hypothetical protein